MKRLILIAMVVLMSAPTVLAQLPCTADFDCDQDVDATDVNEFLDQFGRSPFNNPCPDCYDSPCPCTASGCDPPAPVPKSGQTTSYEPGDDGYYQKGVAWPNPRFTDNGDGTVRDNLTGLIWLKDAGCFESTFFAQALNDCNWLNDPECGLSDGSTPGDWRMPNANEMSSLIDRSNIPAIPSGHPFSLTSTIFWSSTTYADDSSSAWAANLYEGRMEIEDKAIWYQPWPVRDPL